ncbi:MAG: ACT domain-containing protein [Christensenellaceae bacterium]|nr:ACT domain-containing protein [Christensenellaceae bacterium]
MNVIISVMGKDKPGIIAKISGMLFEYNANILDLSQTVLRENEIFTMVTLADVANINVSFAQFREGMEKAGEEIGVEVQVRKEELFTTMHRV